MGLIKKLLTEHKWLLPVVVIGSFFRLWQLGIVPQGITHDEMGYIFNAYSVSQTGRNVFSEFMPFLTWMNQGAFPFMPGTIYVMVPFYFFMELSSFSARFPSALFGILDITLLYILVSQLFKNKSLATLSALFLAISPWHLHFSRTAYDTNFSLFFYLWGIVLFMHEIRSKKLPIFSSLAFLIGSYAYRGMSIIALPLLTALFAYSFYVLKASRRQIVFFAGFIVIFVTSLLMVSLSFGQSYTKEGQALFSNPKIQEEIDTKSREAQGPLILKRIFLNKPTQIINEFRENYIKSYSPEFLLLYTEPSQIYSIWSRGRIYFVDVIFIALGGFFLFKLKKKETLLVLGLLLIGGLPGGLGGLPYSSRNFFVAAILPIFTAGGVLFILNLTKSKRCKVVLGVFFVILYTYLFSSYLFDYYYRYAYQASEHWAKSIKDVSVLINSNTQEDRIVVAPSSFGDIVQYAFYTNILPAELQKIWKNKKQDTYSYKNISFIAECTGLKQDYKTLIIVGKDCLKEATPSAYIRDYYGNPIWRVYEK